MQHPVGAVAEDDPAAQAHAGHVHDAVQVERLFPGSHVSGPQAADPQDALLEPRQQRGAQQLIQRIRQGQADRGDGAASSATDLRLGLHLCQRTRKRRQWRKGPPSGDARSHRLVAEEVVRSPDAAAAGKSVQHRVTHLGHGDQRRPRYPRRDPARGLERGAQVVLARKYERGDRRGRARPATVARWARWASGCRAGRGRIRTAPWCGRRVRGSRPAAPGAFASATAARAFTGVVRSHGSGPSSHTVAVYSASLR